MSIVFDQPYELTKSLWTDEDFDQMGWHDVHIHGFAFDTEKFELLLDLDYIFAWVNPAPNEEQYTFWMSPCTLVFWNVHSFSAQVEWGLGLEISDVAREDAGRPINAGLEGQEQEWRWIFSCQEGQLSFHSVGYRQYTRAKPVRSQGQMFSWASRGGVCFDRVTFDTTRL